MSCDKYREMISARLDSELSSEEEKTLMSHLEACSECGRFANELRLLTERGSSLPIEPMPAALEAGILSQTIESSGERKSLMSYFHGYYRVPRGLAWVTLLAALLLVTDAIIKTDLRQTTVDETPAEIHVADNDDNGVKKIVLSEDDIVSTSIILKPTEDG